jgi:hypothetical protein
MRLRSFRPEVLQDDCSRQDVQSESVAARNLRELIVPP